ncbi:UDP-galactose transporter [Ascodesmis nigricans]|uniref:GDP-mannose transporter n=1 Tax=Ascodesmis nigricans TaxID=341454 RepID=A0A4S2N7G1_9PEZI|nr:UDP-galactose transporter [Ascodesmis nigricans]
MSEKEKQEDFRVEIGNEKRDFSPTPLRPSPSASSSSGVTNNPAIAILAYCGASILMTLTNKYVLSGVEFNMNFLLLCVQNLVCVIAISFCKSLRLITYRDFKWDEGRKWFPISLLLISMIYTGSKAIQYLSIPVYTIFKNLTIILIAYGEVLWFGGSVSPMTLLSFGLMVVSSIVAAWADIQHALDTSLDQVSTLNAGYMWMLVNCFSSAAFVLGMRKRIKLTNFKDFDTMFYNNLLSIPIIAICSLLTEDWSAENINKNFPEATRNAMITAMVISGLSSIFISYSSAWCVRVTTSTTYSMVGALNKLPIAISGLIFFDAPVTFGSVSAIGLGFVSGVIYSVSKIRGKAQQEQTLPTSSSSASMRDGLKARD